MNGAAGWAALFFLVIGLTFFIRRAKIGIGIMNQNDFDISMQYESLIRNGEKDMKNRCSQFMGLGISLLLAGIAAWGTTDVPVQAVKKVKSVKISAGSYLLINKGEKKKLNVKVSPRRASNKKIEWKTSRRKIVFVNQKGVIRGKKYGRANIYAKAKDGSGKRAKICVQVGKKVKSVKLSTGTVVMDVGGTANLKATVLPSNATKGKLRYQSSNKKVATVSSTGEVRGKTAGTTTIRAASRDGTNKSASCKVMVRIPSQSVKLSVNEPVLRITQGMTVRVNAEVLPSNATNREFYYTSSNMAIMKVSQMGDVTALSPGRAVLRVDAADGKSSATLEVEVYGMELHGEKLIAHRGYSSQAPENTTAAFQLALDNGFFGIECDVRKTLDDQFVIMHDADLRRMCGYNLDISNLTLSQIQQYDITAGSNIAAYPGLKIPTLKEYLEILAGDGTVHPFIELKEKYSDTELKNLVKLVDEYGLLDRTYFISVYQDNLLALKKIEGVNLSQLQYVYGAEEFNKLTPVPDEVLDWCIVNAIDLDARYTLLTASHVSRLKDSGRKVNVWTVNAVEKAYQLVNDCQVDMITTEYMLNS